MAPPLPDWDNIWSLSSLGGYQTFPIVLVGKKYLYCIALDSGSRIVGVRTGLLLLFCYRGGQIRHATTVLDFLLEKGKITSLFFKNNNRTSEKIKNIQYYQFSIPDIWNIPEKWHI